MFLCSKSWPRLLLKNKAEMATQREKGGKLHFEARYCAKMFILYWPILTPTGAGWHEEQAGRNPQECAFFYTAQLRDEHKVPHKTREPELERHILQKCSNYIR
jgi:hypothetical protein